MPDNGKGAFGKYDYRGYMKNILIFTVGCKDNAEHNIFKGSPASAFVIVFNSRICNVIQLLHLAGTEAFFKRVFAAENNML